MARGALISMLVVVFILPSMFMVFDKVIVKTSKKFPATEGRDKIGGVEIMRIEK